MNELDKEIDQFKINLNEINKCTKSLSDSNEAFNKIKGGSNESP